MRQLCTKCRQLKVIVDQLGRCTTCSPDPWGSAPAARKRAAKASAKKAAPKTTKGSR